MPALEQEALSAERSAAVRNRRVLVVAFHYLPSLATGAQRPHRFVKYLGPLGYEARVITSAPQSHGAETGPVMEASPRAASGRAARWSRVGAALQRVLPYNDQLPWTPLAVEAAIRSVREWRPDVILSTAPPLACHLAAMRLSRILEVPWVADFRDPLYGNPSRIRSWGPLWDAPVERLLVRSASAVIANTDASVAMLHQRYPNQRGKFHLLWNGFDPAEVLSPLPVPVRKFKLMVHAGSLYGQRHPSAVLSSLHRLVAAGSLSADLVRLRLIGEVEAHAPWLKEQPFAALTSLGCLECTGVAAPRAEAAREMAEADSLLLLDVNSRGLGLQVPAKLFEYIQIGRPVLAFTARGSAVERILQRGGTPHALVYPDDPPAEVDRKALPLFSDPAQASEPSAWFREQFDGAAQTRTLARILDAVVERGR